MSGDFKPVFTKGKSVFQDALSAVSVLSNLCKILGKVFGKDLT